MTILFYAQHALLLALLSAVAAGAGTLALGRRGGLALRTTVGLALLGEVFFLLGLFDVLRRGPIIACGVIALIGGVIRGGRWSASRPALVTAIGAALLPLFVLALYPPVNFDETLYHLPFVRTFARTGGIPFLPHLRFPMFPQLHELLCVPLFLFGGDTSIHLVALLETLLTVALLWDWGRRYAAPAGPLAAALFLGSPAVVQLATIGYVDAAETLFVTATLYALDRARETGWRWAALAGVLAGAACRVKYVGGYFAVAGLIVLLVRRDRRGLGAYAAGLTAAALPTYARLLYWTGNPVFPFFGSSPWNQPLESIPSPERFVRAIRAAYDVTFARDRVNQQPPFTPLVIVMALVILAAAIRGRRARAVVVLCAAYLAIFTFLPQDARYLVPLLPLVSVTAAAIVGPWLIERRTFAAIVTLLAVWPGIAYALYRIARAGPPPVTPSARRAFLERKIPELPALSHAGPGLLYVCGAEQLQYFRDDDSLRGDHTGLNAYKNVRADFGGLADQGFRYVLVSKRVCGDAPVAGGQIVYDDAAARLWQLR